MSRTKDETIDYLKRLREVHKSESVRAREKGDDREFFYRAGMADVLRDVVEIVRKMNQ